MSKNVFRDKRHQQLIAGFISKYLNAAGDLCGGDHGYPAYLGFTTLGSLILKSFGREALLSYVDEILAVNDEDKLPYGDEPHDKRGPR